MLPVVDRTAWINRGNRPEKVTAKPSARLKQSAKGSVGGKGIHMTPDGIAIVMRAPRLHADVPVEAPLAAPDYVRIDAQNGVPILVDGRTGRDIGRAGMPEWSPPAGKPSMCPMCGEWFPSKRVRGRHQHDCGWSEAD